jgi:hypothetical protein
MSGSIQVGSRVYLRVAVCGEPGCVVQIDERGRAKVLWPDMPELGRHTSHSIESLVLTESLKAQQFVLAFDEVAA